MGSRIPSVMRQSPWRWLGVALVFSVLLVAAVVVLAQSPQQPPDPVIEPVAFNHKTHVDKGIDCLYCHSNAPRGQVASIPSVEKCIGCHQVVTPQNPQSAAEVEKIRKAWELGVPLRWEKKFDQPDFVYFSHRPHIQANVDCAECHGDVGSIAMPEPGYYVTMGFCLNCHRQQAPEKVAKLTDCATCHK